MLVLKRKSGEALMIGDNIYIKIMRVDGDKVKLAIEAPKDVNVFRTELIDAAENNQEAADIPDSTIQSLKKILHRKFEDE